MLSYSGNVPECDDERNPNLSPAPSALPTVILLTSGVDSELRTFAADSRETFPALRSLTLSTNVCRKLKQRCRPLSGTPTLCLRWLDAPRAKLQAESRFLYFSLLSNMDVGPTLVRVGFLPNVHTHGGNTSILRTRRRPQRCHNRRLLTYCFDMSRYLGHRPFVTMRVFEK